MPLSDWTDVTAARHSADAHADTAAKIPLGEHREIGALMEQLEALRYEVRAAAMLLSHTVGELLWDSRRR